MSDMKMIAVMITVITVRVKGIITRLLRATDRSTNFDEDEAS